jgi:hypothetical protein
MLFVYTIIGVGALILLGFFVCMVIETYGPERPLNQNCWKCGEPALDVTRAGKWDGDRIGQSGTLCGGGSFTEAECRKCGTKYENYTGIWEQAE